jgi:methylmalonyl-CoA mutase
VERLTRDIARRAREVIEEVEAAGGMAKAIEAGLPRRRIEAAAAARQARVDRGLDLVVGVNAHQSEAGEPTPVRVVDSAAVERAQIERLTALRATRDGGMVMAALAALRASAGDGGNLLEASIRAMRARATVGEVSEALAELLGRYEAPVGLVSGTYGSHFQGDERFEALVSRVSDFLGKRGRRPRVLIAKIGQDGHDRGQKVVATGLTDLGFDVDLGPLFSTPEEVARHAIENDVHAVGVSTQAGAHLTLLPALVGALGDRGVADIEVVCGGVIPPQDHAALRQAGVSLVFGPGTSVLDVAADLLDLLEKRDA